MSSIELYNFSQTTKLTRTKALLDTFALVRMRSLNCHDNQLQAKTFSLCLSKGN